MSNPNDQYTLNKGRRQASFLTMREFNRGIMGNLLAARCEILTDRELVSLLWWVQRASWRDGGLHGLSERFLRDYGHLLGTRSMHRLGRAPGRVYSAKEVEAIRGEFRVPNRNYRDIFPLRGEVSLQAEMGMSSIRDEQRLNDRRAASAERANSNPTSYSVEDLLEHCSMDAAKLAGELEALLLDPKLDPKAGLWNLPGLIAGLADMRAKEIAAAAAAIVETEVTGMVSDILDFALQQRAFVVIEGREGIGKTEAAENWCARHPGQAVYVKLESGADDRTFFRTIARQIGVSSSRGASDIRLRTEDALQSGQLMLVIDEAHFLWPTPDRPSRIAPRRVDWLRTAIIDHGVPVAIVSTPQFFETQCSRFLQGGWNALQFQRRITETVTLPEQLNVADVLGVARVAFPTVDEPTLKRIGAFALGSVGYLTSIKHARQLAEFERSKHRGLSVQEAVLRVLERKGLAGRPAAEATPQDRVNDTLSRREAAPRTGRFSAVSEPQPRTTSAQVVPL